MVKHECINELYDQDVAKHPYINIFEIKIWPTNNIIASFALKMWFNNEMLTNYMLKMRSNMHVS